MFRLGSVLLLLLLFLSGCNHQGTPNEQLLSPGVQTPWGLLRGDPSLGRLKAQQWCSGCHKVDGSGNHLAGAPPFAQTVAREDVDAVLLKRWLRDPAAIKPGTLMPNLGLSDPDIEHLLAYLYSLKQAQ